MSTHSRTVQQTAHDDLLRACRRYIYRAIKCD
jgi:hypothetical protein